MLPYCDLVIPNGIKEFGNISSHDGLLPVLGTEPLSEQMLCYFQLDPWEQTSVKFCLKFKYFHSRKSISKCRLENVGHFVSASMYQYSCNITVLFISLHEFSDHPKAFEPTILWPINWHGLMLMWYHIFMMSSNGNIFRVTGHLCLEFTGDRWIPRTKARDMELWCFLWSASE